MSIWGKLIMGIEEGKLFNMDEIAITIAVGVIIAVVSNVIAHYLAIERSKSEAHECDEKHDEISHSHYK